MCGLGTLGIRDASPMVLDAPILSFFCFPKLVIETYKV